MRIATVICSFNSPDLTKRVYDLMLKNKKHDIFVLENSTDEAKMFKEGNVIDMGRENKGFGGMHDFIFTHPLFRTYDFVGIFNNDVYDIPSNYIEDIEKYIDTNVGIISSAFKREGSNWEHMWKWGRGYRDVDHIEDMACYFNTKLFDKLATFIPFGFYGVQDIVLSQAYKKNGYVLRIVDDIEIGHMLAGARKEAGVFDEYIRNYGKEIGKWCDRNAEVKGLYEGYINAISSDVAVIIPNYNHNHLLERAIRSVMKQGVKTDIIVIDDGSDKDPFDEIKHLPIRYFKHGNNRGLSAARNTGISATKAKYVLPLDADDELHDNVLLKMLNQIKAEGDIVHGNLEWRASRSVLKPSMDTTPEGFYANNQIFGSSLYKRQLWLDVGGYWEEKEYYEDWTMWYKMCLKGAKFRYIDMNVYLYAGEPGGMCDRLGKERDMNVEKVRKHIEEWKRLYL